MAEPREVRVVVIGAGQAGLSSAYFLLRKNLEPHRDFVVLDSNDGPGGAWRHRWPSLTFDEAHALHDLPGMPLGTPDPREPASGVVSRYYARFEERFEVPILRPAQASGVRRVDGGLEVTVRDGRSWRADAVINATGTWTRPYWPSYPGRERFTGLQLHTRNFRSAEEFSGLRVLVVGGGTSAVQFLLQLAAAGAQTFWSTRTPPRFTRRAFDPEWGREVEAEVDGRTRAGLPPASVVSATGLPLTPRYQAGIDAGILASRGPLARLTEQGVVFGDGSAEEVDVVLWATGFRAALNHLAPLHLREPGGGVRMDGVRVLREPRLFLVGYGASASTLGATRAGRAAALAAVDVPARAQVPVGAGNLAL